MAYIMNFSKNFLSNNNKKLILLLSITLSLVLSTRSINISQEEVTQEELIKRIKTFNDWYHKINPSSSHLEAYIDHESNIRLKTNKELKTDDILFNGERKKNIITSIDIYENSKYAETIQSIEETYGFDDITNLTLFLLIEKHNPNSYWKPYLDILPSQPKTLLWNYWNNKKTIEPKFNNSSIISKENKNKNLYKNNFINY